MKRGKLNWKYFLLFLLAFSVFLPVYSESKTELLEVPNLEPEVIYEMTGADIMTLYQTINDSHETVTEYQSLANEMMKTLNDAGTLVHEYVKENRKLQLENNLLIGGITLSVGVCVASAVVFAVTNMK